MAVGHMPNRIGDPMRVSRRLLDQTTLAGVVPSTKPFCCIIRVGPCTVVPQIQCRDALSSLILDSYSINTRSIILV